MAPCPREFYFAEGSVRSDVVTIKRENPVTAPVVTAENTASGIRIKWNAVEGATSYIIFRTDPGTNVFRRMNTVNGDTTSYMNKSPVAGSTYDYYVEAYSADESARSNTVTIKRLNP